MADDDWKRRWREIGPERRRSIRRAIQRGEAVSDARDAPIAVALIDRRKQRTELHAGTRTMFSPRHFVLLVALGVIFGILGKDFTAVAIAVLIAVYLIPMRLFLNRLETRANAAREKNARLASAFYGRESAPE